MVLFGATSVKVVCASDLDFAGIIDQADEKLFQVVLITNPNHVLFSLYPDKTEQHYYVNKRLQVTLDQGDRGRGDWKCRSGKCDTDKIAGVENAGVENAGADRSGGKCSSKP